MNLPNQLTLARLGLTGIFIAITALPDTLHWQNPTLLLLFIIASITDWLDGHLARKWNLITDFGKLFDPLADKILITAALFYLVDIHQIPAWMATLMIARELLITGLRILAAAKGQILAAEKIGKHKTISQMVAIITALTYGALPHLNPWLGTQLQTEPLTHLLQLTLAPLFYIATTITILSGIIYLHKNRQIVLTH